MRTKLLHLSAPVILTAALLGCSEEPAEETLREATADLRESKEELAGTRADFEEAQGELQQQRMEAQGALAQTQEQLEAKVAATVQQAQQQIDQAGQSVSSRIDETMQRAEQALQDRQWDQASDAVDALRQLDLDDAEAERLDGIMRGIDEAQATQQTLDQAKQTLDAADMTK